ncbi:S41 family peptidase [Reichenbachiella versicolor]|uniref:S41 family peptidase n=1 Tax=Reichenbachiella versicolor TaxID=1821036 RepID=UPI0013A5A7ED|nr:S41 family peptidase [Reichenbachiella versicolor]
MTLRFYSLLLALLFPYIVFGQNSLTKEQVTEDYQILKNILTKGYPSLYEYTSQNEWDSLFTNFEQNQIKTIHSDNDLYKSITELTDYARDGHLIIMRPQLTSIPKLFPLLLKIINDKLYTDTEDFGIPLGSEIVSIDGVDGFELIKKFMKYAPSDGFNTSKKERQVEREFGILHFYEFGEKSRYKVKYKTPSNQETVRSVESQTFESIGKRYSNRNSFFGKKTLGKQEPFLYFIDSLNTTVLTMNTFSLDGEKFQEALKDIFKEIKQRKSDHLIIDIRQNEGGYPLNAINSFSYIASQPFRQRLSSEVITASLPEEPYSQNLVNGFTYESFFNKYYKDAKRQQGKWILDQDENEPFMIPNKKKFEGKVYVLIGGKTFSAGSSFALFCKNEGISLIGEETGGGYYTQTGGYPMIYTLPNSQIKILISFVKIARFVKDRTIKRGQGIIPDHEVYLTVEDLIRGRDTQLNYVLKQIDSK